MLSLSMGVAVSVGLAMVRVLTGISIFWMLIPGYALALGLSFFVPKIFTAIAFDSGGVASGPMTATFLLPFAMGACVSVGGNIVTDAFGVVAIGCNDSFDYDPGAWCCIRTAVQTTSRKWKCRRQQKFLLSFRMTIS